MKTAEEFWEEKYKYGFDKSKCSYSYQSVIDFANEFHKQAMEEYAKQQAVEFAKWLANYDTEILLKKDGRWVTLSGPENDEFKYFTDEELFKLWKDERTTENNG